MSSQPPYQVNFEYSTSLARKGLLAYLCKRHTVFLIATPFFLWFAVSNFFSPDYGPLAGLALGILAVYWSSWLGAFRINRQTASASSNARIDITIAEDGVHFASDLVVSSVKWPAIKFLFCTKHFVFLLRQGISNPSPIPVAALPDGALALLQSKVKESGGKVR